MRWLLRDGEVLTVEGDGGVELLSAQRRGGAGSGALLGDRSRTVVRIP